MKHTIALAVVTLQLISLATNTQAGKPTDYLLRDSAVRDQNGDITAPCISPGGEYSSFKLLYWNYPPVVRGGQKVIHRIAWERIGANPNAVLYLTVIGNWNPDEPLATLINGGFQAVGETMVAEVEFTAPQKRGIYRIRWIMAAAFSPVTNFYSKEDDQNPVWSEIVFRVE